MHGSEDGVPRRRSPKGFGGLNTAAIFTIVLKTKKIECFKNNAF